MEDNADREQQLGKLFKIRNTYQKIAEIASEECSIVSRQSQFRLQLFRKLSKYTNFLFFLNIDDLEKDKIKIQYDKFTNYNEELSNR